MSSENTDDAEKIPTELPTGKQLAIKYKFRALKIYSSNEWMADATKRYRQVYDRFETTYMRAELSFFNKLFDEEDWEATVQMKVFFSSGSQKNELYTFVEKRKILKDENIVYVRSSWGVEKPGDYWFKGNYVWEGYIDEVKIGEGKFYVEDVGQAKEDENLYFDIQSVKLFEGDMNASTNPSNKYYTTFKKQDTRFIWGEFNFKNKTDKDYYAELFFNFFDEAGRLKGSTPYLTYVAANTKDKLYTISNGWGGQTPGTWDGEAYTLEIVFMDNLIATVPFRVGDEFVEGDPVMITEKGQSAYLGSGSVSESNLDNLLFESLDELNSLTGLHTIKNEVNEMVKLVQFYKETGKDILNHFSLHTVFTGNPGTGKTTVARLLAKIYKGLGVLEKGHLIEVDREGLVAGYVGQTAIKTGEKVTEAMGGILFIDEAYSLARENGSQHDFGGEAIQVILKRMEDLRGKFGVIVAGYTGNMQEFINSNPGLRSRFDKYFEFGDYTTEDMLVIAMNMFNKENVKVDPTAWEHLKNYFAFLFENRDKYFGNARTVRQVVAEIIKNQHLRLASMKKEDRTEAIMETIIFDDVKEFEIKESTSNRPSLGFQTGAS